MNEAEQLRKEIDLLKIDLDSKTRRLESLVNNCNHKWSAVKYDPEDGFTTEADGYEYHGSDMWPKTKMIRCKKDRWSRTCVCCGKIEYTYNQKSTTTYSPDFK